MCYSRSNRGARHALTWSLAEIYESPERRQATPVLDSKTKLVVAYNFDGRRFKSTPSGQFVPIEIYDRVSSKPGSPTPSTAEDFYHRYWQLTWLRRSYVTPIFLCLFILFLYLVGKLLAAGVGRFLWAQIELLIHRLPLIRTVYGSVKQVTDFVFSESDIEFTRVVAVEYPRHGMWSLGFVTGDSMRDLASAANEPVLSVLMPTSPMPATGFTITVRKSETIDLNLTIDQAFQFIVSCGVVVPRVQRQQTDVVAAISSAVSQRMIGQPSSEPTALPTTSIDGAVSVQDTVSDNGSNSKGSPASSTTLPPAQPRKTEPPRVE